MHNGNLSRCILNCKRYTKSVFNNHLHSSLRTAIAAATAEKYEDPALATAKPLKDMPRVPALPVIGSSWTYFPIIGRYDVRKMHKADVHKHQTYGDTVYEKAGDFGIVLSFLPETMEILNRHEGQYPSRGDFSTLKTYRESRKEYYKSTGIMVLQGKEWHDLRSKTQKHLMKPRSIQAFLQPMQDVARDFVHLIRRNRDAQMEVPGLLEELYKWSLESVATVGLDTRLGCLNKDLPADSDGKKMINAVQTMFHSMNKLEVFSGNFPFWKYFSTPTWKKFAKAGDTFTEIAYKYINKSLEKLKTLSDEETELTLLQSMLMEKGLEISGIMVTVADMLMAGIDTTANSVGFLLYELAKNPDKQQLVFKEINELLPMKEDRMTPEIYNKLHYLKACLKESLRLHAITRGIFRSFDHDIVVNGYRVPAGNAVICVNQLIFKKEEYFENPDQFIPERWLDKNNKIYPFAFVPFGLGTRSCIGRRLAELEIFSLLTEIIRNFTVEYHYEDIDMCTHLINVPDKPLRLNFLDR